MRDGVKGRFCQKVVRRRMFSEQSLYALHFVFKYIQHEISGNIQLTRGLPFYPKEREHSIRDDFVLY